MRKQDLRERCCLMREKDNEWWPLLVKQSAESEINLREARSSSLLMKSMSQPHILIEEAVFDKLSRRQKTCSYVHIGFFVPC